MDMVLFLNGLPVATVEPKNPLTGQNVEHAISQYQRRDPKHRLFHFKKRALVHFAVDPDLAYMTTRLAGKETVFLPFNRGCGGGKGNPSHPSGPSLIRSWLGGRTTRFAAEGVGNRAGDRVSGGTDA